MISSRVVVWGEPRNLGHRQLFERANVSRLELWCISPHVGGLEHAFESYVGATPPVGWPACSNAAEVGIESGLCQIVLQCDLL